MLSTSYLPIPHAMHRYLTQCSSSLYHPSYHPLSLRPQVFHFVDMVNIENVWKSLKICKYINQAPMFPDSCEPWTFGFVHLPGLKYRRALFTSLIACANHSQNVYECVVRQKGLGRCPCGLVIACGAAPNNAHVSGPDGTSAPPRACTCAAAIWTQPNLTVAYCSHFWKHAGWDCGTPAAHPLRARGSKKMTSHTKWLPWSPDDHL